MKKGDDTLNKFPVKLFQGDASGKITEKNMLESKCGILWNSFGRKYFFFFIIKNWYFLHGSKKNG